MRKGVKRLTPGALFGKTVYGSYVWTGTDGIDYIVLACEDVLFRYDSKGNFIVPSTGVPYPAGETISSTDVVDIVQANGQLFIFRGTNKSPIIWNGSVNISTVNITVAPSGAGAYHKLPNSTSAIYNGNRMIVAQCANWNKTTGTSTSNVNDEISVSHYLDFTEFELLDVFKINDGSNDRLVGIAPWVLNEFVAFMRNSIYYCSVGAGAEATGHSIDVADCYVKVLAKDIGCIARKSIVQASGGIIFLSDNGVFIMQPSNATTPEGMRVGVLGEPISAPIDDIIQTINVEYAHNAVASYFENRYYLAVPTGTSTVNNTVLVFNFLNKAWESVDTFSAGFDVSNMLIGLYGNKRRLMYIDKQEGVFVADENEYWDEIDDSTALVNRFDNMYFDTIDFEEGQFNKYAIYCEITTRSFNFDTPTSKRFASVEMDAFIPAGGQMETKVLTTNPDTVTVVDKFGSHSTEEYSRLRPVRKNASSAQVNIKISNRRISIKNLFMSIIDTGRNLISKQ